MADNLTTTTTVSTIPSGTVISTDDAGANGHIQRMKLTYGADGDATHIGADANGLDVDVTRLPALPAGTNNIGDVDVLTLPALPAGSNNIGDVDVLTVPADPFGVNADAASASGSISAKLRFIASTGIPVTGTVTVSGTVTATIAPKAVLWQSSPTSRSTVLTTELNALGNAAYSGVGTALDNTSNGDQYGACEISLSSLNPTTGAYLSLYIVQSLGGTNYEDAPSSTNPGTHMLVATVLVTTGSATKLIATPWFRLPPGKFKFVLYNATTVSLGATGNTVTLYTDNDELQ